SFSYSLPPPHPHSFPTRRSSDLSRRKRSSVAPPVPGTFASQAFMYRREKVSKRCQFAPGPGEIVGSTKPPMDSTMLSSAPNIPRSEEHTSELQSRSDLVCRLLLE